MYAEQPKSNSLNTALGTVSKNQAIAEKLALKAEKLNDRLMELEKKVIGKLEPICEQPKPMPESASIAAQEEWPPYFARLRDILEASNKSCVFIERTIDRVAL